MDIRQTEEYQKHGYKVVICPICGSQTLDTYYICEKCMWEYDGVTAEDAYSAANSATVRRYRQQWQSKA